MGHGQELFVKGTANSKWPLDKIIHFIQKARIDVDVFIHFQEFLADQVTAMVMIGDYTGRLQNLVIIRGDRDRVWTVRMDPVPSGRVASSLSEKRE